jgi:hypothetical protein
MREVEVRRPGGARHTLVTVPGTWSYLRACMAIAAAEPNPAALWKVRRTCLSVPGTQPAAPGTAGSRRAAATE